MKYLRSFGEMAVIAISDAKKMGSKLDTRLEYLLVMLMTMQEMYIDS